MKKDSINMPADEQSLVKQLQQLPENAFLGLQYLQTQVGCPNICAMCSQGASKNITKLTRQGIHNLFDALKIVIAEKFPDRSSVLGRGREEHKPGVIFPYLDTDVGSDRNLFEVIQRLDSDFQCKVRIATVGYSRHNDELQRMHERIANELPHAIDGFRVSLTPYTYGLHTRDGLSARSEYISDFANLLRTYKPLLQIIGAGKEKFAVEIRNKPLIKVYDRDLDEMILQDRHVFRSGPYLFMAIDKGIVPQTSMLIALHERSAEFSQPPLHYLVALSDQHIGEGDWESVAEHIAKDIDAAKEDPAFFAQQHYGDALRLRIGEGYRFENSDGPFYSIDPTFTEQGVFMAINVYGKTASRRVSGYNDATRYLLNLLIEFKASKGLQRRDIVDNASWDDVEQVISMLQSKANALSSHHKTAAEHLQQEVLPLIEAYIAALKEADYDPSIFFDRNFTIDTGQIVNQGRAITQFRGLVTKEDEPFTAHDMRGYGKDISFSSMRDHVWRIAPVPMAATSNRVQLGFKNPSGSDELSGMGSISVSKLDRFTLYPVETVIIDGVEVEKITIEDARQKLMIPGVRQNQPTENVSSEEPNTLLKSPQAMSTLKLTFGNIEYYDLSEEVDIEKLCAEKQKQAAEQGIKAHVVCGVVVCGNKLLVVNRALDDELAPGAPEMPGGGVDDGESLCEAIRRELKEELGRHDLVIEKMLGHFDVAYNDSQTRQFTFLIRVSSEDVVLNAQEHSSASWIDFDDKEALSQIKFYNPSEEAMVKKAQEILQS